MNKSLFKDHAFNCAPLESYALEYYELVQGWVQYSLSFIFLLLHTFVVNISMEAFVCKMEINIIKKM